MEVIIITMLIIGLVLIVVSMLMIKKDEYSRKNLNQKLDDAVNVVNYSLDNFEIQTNEFNKTCELIFVEIDEKYQELLYLYNLIEEQQINSVAQNNEYTKLEEQENIIEEKIEKPKKKVDNRFIFKNKNAVEIFKLYDDGVPISEIAKSLSIGQGEVKLMLNIRKA